MYQKHPDTKFGVAQSIGRLTDGAAIPFDPANTDYAKFKDDILKGNAELQDSEGVVMSPDAAKEFVRTLP